MATCCGFVVCDGTHSVLLFFLFPFDMYVCMYVTIRRDISIKTVLGAGIQCSKKRNR